MTISIYVPSYVNVGSYVYQTLHKNRAVFVGNLNVTEYILKKAFNGRLVPLGNFANFFSKTHIMKWLNKFNTAFNNI